MLTRHNFASVYLLACVGVGVSACSSSSASADAPTEDDAQNQDETSVADSSVGDVDGESTTDGDNGAPSKIYPAFSAASLGLPIEESRGGPVITKPQIVVVTFASDASADLVDAFNDELAASSYWSTVTGEYGVGSPLTIVKKVRIAKDPGAKVDFNAVEALLKANFGASAPLGPSDSSTLYALYFPDTTSLTNGAATSCGFWGYHDEIGSTKIGFAAIARCPAKPPYTGLERSFSTASHEYVEWATDPYVRSNPAFDHVSQSAWNIAGAEVGDLCEPFGPSILQRPGSGSTGLIQRTWSNASSQAVHHPCLPIPTGEPYFNASPILPDVLLDGKPYPDGGARTTPGVKVPIGTTRTVTLQLFSDRDTGGKWTVSTTLSDSRFTYAFDRTEGENGEKLHLTITASTDSTDAGTSTIGRVVILSQLGSQYTIWPFAISN